MAKKITLSESQLDRLVSNIIEEQGILDLVPQGAKDLVPNDAKKLVRQGVKSLKQDVGSLKQGAKDLVPQGVKYFFSTPEVKALKCVPWEFRVPVAELLKKGYDKQILKVALAVIGRESSYGSGLRYNIAQPIKAIGNLLGVDTSVGPGQMKQDTADELGVKENISSIRGALIAVYKYISGSYQSAQAKAYATGKPSVNFANGTQNAALDLAIASYNIGKGRVSFYCKTSDPNVKKPCTQPNTNGVGAIVPNYLPNYKTERWDGVNTSTHGYVQEVAKRIKTFTCF
jgi:hypothetical protein